jgi:hypothetical protein
MDSLKKYLLVFNGIVALLVAGGCSDTVESTYPSLCEAETSGAVERGWVPGFLLNCSDLREIHAVDTNERWGTFRFPKGASPVVPEKVQVVPPDEIGKIRFRAPKVSWWSPVLQPSLSSSSLSDAGFQMIREREGTLVLALNTRSGTGYFWSVEP